jgi:SAM-dependent methyltransferase
MIKTIPVENVAHKDVFFPVMPLAFEWCQGEGLEIGAAAHNPFALPGCLNVAPDDEDMGHPWAIDAEFWREVQTDMCGEYAVIDVPALADNIPLKDNSQDYVISSHVVEHMPNPFAAFVEWDRLVRDGGIIFMIFPSRTADPEDAAKPIVEIDKLVGAYQDGLENMPFTGHKFVYNPQSMKQAVKILCQNSSLNWEVVAEEFRDSKVGNGHTVVWQVSKPPKRKNKPRKSKKKDNPFTAVDLPGVLVTGMREDLTEPITKE